MKRYRCGFRLIERIINAGFIYNNYVSNCCRGFTAAVRMFAQRNRRGAKRALRDCILAMKRAEALKRKGFDVKRAKPNLGRSQLLLTRKKKNK